jgi:hypothetical protein
VADPGNFEGGGGAVDGMKTSIDVIHNTFSNIFYY